MEANRSDWSALFKKIGLAEDTLVDKLVVNGFLNFIIVSFYYFIIFIILFF